MRVRVDLPRDLRDALADSGYSCLSLSAGKSGDIDSRYLLPALRESAKPNPYLNTGGKVIYSLMAKINLLQNEGSPVPAAPLARDDNKVNARG